MRALIARGIVAKGGEANEAKYKAATMKGTGTFYGLGDGIPITGEWSFQGRDQSRSALEIKIMDQTLTFTQVVNGAKGWVKFNDEVKTMPKEELAEEQASNYTRWVCSLIPLKDKAFKLSGVGEVKVGDQAATGIRVSRAGKRDINLFFDKASGLLVKSETQIKDVKGGGDREMTEEVFLADYKDFQGLKYPTKITINRDGKQFVEASMTELHPLEMIDDALFGQP